MGSPASPPAETASSLLARLDRLPVWSLPNLFIGVLGAGFLFTFYDIFDINVSFIQTCSAIVPHCTPATASSYLGWPVLFNLLGYVVGTLSLSPLSDRLGRRTMLMITLSLTGLGSLWTAFVTNYAWFVIARAVTGLGIGADLAIVNTYINEVAPIRGRARFTALLFILSSVGAFLGIWIGLLLTTPAAPWPMGLPLALASPHFGDGWRIMYGFGALLALVGIFLRIQLPESPRWLVAHDRLSEAEAVVSSMEDLARVRHPNLPDPTPETARIIAASALPYRDIFISARYRRRTALLLAVWLCSYVTVYAYAAGLTTILSALHYPPPEAGVIAAMGGLGFIASALFAYAFGERLERKTWLPISAALTLAGGISLAAAGHAIAWSFLGSLVLFFGFNLWVPMAYSWSTENYPTRARATGFALVDGLGHFGGGIGIVVIAPLIPLLGALRSFLLITAFLAVAAVMAQFGVNTRAKGLDDISP
jgi:MFS family permease